MDDCYKNQSLNKILSLLNILKSSTVPIAKHNTFGKVENKQLLFNKINQCIPIWKYYKNTYTCCIHTYSHQFYQEKSPCLATVKHTTTSYNKKWIGACLILKLTIP